jgi:hypothetical protein
LIFNYLSRTKRAANVVSYFEFSNRLKHNIYTNVTASKVWLKPLAGYLLFRPINGTAMISNFIAVGFSQRIKNSSKSPRL